MPLPLLDLWSAQVSRHLAHLNAGVRRGLSLYSFGIIMLGTSGQSTVVAFLSLLLARPFNTVRQQVREVVYDHGDKAGRKRTDFDITTCFVPLLQWMLHCFAPDQRTLVLAIDVTYLRDTFAVFAVSVVIGGSSIPVGWHIQPTTQKGAWNPVWQRLLRTLHTVVPADWQVVVLGDGGLYSKALFTFIRDQLHWHPHLRIDRQGLYQDSSGAWQPLSSLVFPGMAPTVCQVCCFKGDPLLCTLLLEWDSQCDKPCMVVTDLPIESARCRTYHLRYWIESGFKDMKRGGLHWEQTKMTDPRRAERLWLVLSLVLLHWTCVSATDPLMTEPHNFLTYQSFSPSTTGLSAVRLGWLFSLVALITHRPLLIRPTLRYDPSDVPIFLHTYP